MRRQLFMTGLFALLALLPAEALATELIMVDDTTCGWCRKWLAETGPGYPRSAEGKRAPLRRVMFRDYNKIGVSFSKPITGTPTFVLVDGGREKGRIVGYLAGPAFYAKLATLLDGAATPAEAAEGPKRSLGDLMRRSLGSKAD